jgi:hypothetical protein
MIKINSNISMFNNCNMFIIYDIFNKTCNICFIDHGNNKIYVYHEWIDSHILNNNEYIYTIEQTNDFQYNIYQYLGYDNNFTLQAVYTITWHLINNKKYFTADHIRNIMKSNLNKDIKDCILIFISNDQQILKYNEE